MKKINVIGNVYVPVNKLKDFCDEINKIKSNVNIKDGRFNINAKSLIELAALKKRNLCIELVPNDIEDIVVFHSILTNYPTM